ncbi:MAG: hypothetical protein ACREUG_00990 [Steroidobacteraceae bacterium]
MRQLRRFDCIGPVWLAMLGAAAAVALGAAAPALASREAVPPAASVLPAMSTASRYVAILWDPATPPGERKLWTVYLYTRAAFLANESGSEQLPLGVRAPSFEGEVRARRVALGLFRQLEAEDSAFGSIYFDDLDQVAAAGFLREYVWRYLKQPSWTRQPQGLRLERFDAWRAVHLRHHVPVTYGRIAVRLAAAAR